MKKRTIRYVLAALSAAFVLAVCLRLTHNSIGGQLEMAQSFTESTFLDVDKSIAFFQMKNGRLPRGLGELATLPDTFFQKKIHRAWSQQFINDYWRNPVIYKVHGNTYSLSSLGADNKVGGTGLDCDLTSENPKPLEAKPTLSQTLSSERAKGMITASIVCAIVTSSLALFAVKERDLTPDKLLFSAMKLSITLIGTSMVALFVTLLHYPSGH